MTTVCNANCVCMNADCSYNHYITIADRKKVVSIVKKFNLTTTSYTTEDNAEKRKKNCTFGFLCFRDDCLYRHRMNNKGRNIIIDNYTSTDEEEEKKVIKKVIKRELNKEDLKEVVVKLSNKFELLKVDDKEEFPEIPSSSTSEEKKPLITFDKSYIEVLKTNPFEVMMNTHYDNWGDYD